jgi:hypothetical protein
VEAIMDLQMQLRRGVIALAIWAVLGGIVLSHARAASAAAGAPRAMASAFDAGHACHGQIQIDIVSGMRLTLPCDRSCASLRSVAQVLRLPVTMLVTHCDAWRTA